MKNNLPKSREQEEEMVEIVEYWNKDTGDHFFGTQKEFKKYFVNGDCLICKS